MIREHRMLEELSKVKATWENLIWIVIERRVDWLGGGIQQSKLIL